MRLTDQIYEILKASMTIYCKKYSIGLSYIEFLLFLKIIASHFVCIVLCVWLPNCTKSLRAIHGATLRLRLARRVGSEAAYTIVNENAWLRANQWKNELRNCGTLNARSVVGWLNNHAGKETTVNQRWKIFTATLAECFAVRSSLIRDV